MGAADSLLMQTLPASRLCAPRPASVATTPHLEICGDRVVGVLDTPSTLPKV